MSQGRDRYRFVLTPAGAGVLSLFTPGLALAVVSRQEMLVVISVGAGLALFVNAVVARHHVKGLVMTVAVPTTTTVGAPFPATVVIHHRRSLECAIAVEYAVKPWIPASVPAKGEVLLSVESRQVLESLRVQIQSSNPFGLIACVRRSELELSRPISVGPQSLAATMPPHSAADSVAGPSQGDDPVGLRPYMEGDSQRDVHWPTVARTGSMIVRDRRGGLNGTEVDVVVECYWSDGDIEELLGRARSVLDQLVAAGHQVRLATTELGSALDTDTGGGPVRPITNWVMGSVGGDKDITERLARVVPTEPGPAPTSLGSSRRLVVNADGLQWLSSS